MGAVRQEPWGIGFLLSSDLYGLFYDVIGWCGLSMIGILPPLLIIYIRLFVKEPAIWVENRRQQTQQGREVRAPLFLIFKPGLLGNTLTTKMTHIDTKHLCWSFRARDETDRGS